MTGKATDVMGNENRARISLIGVAWWRDDLPHEVLNRYWRDVHGVLDARLPGLYWYRQYQVDAARSDLFAPIEGITYAWTQAEQANAIASMAFLDQAARELPRTSPLWPYVESDNLVLVKRNVHYVVEDAGRTYLDRTGSDGTPQGKVASPTFGVFFRCREGVALETFHARLRSLAEKWSRLDDVLRVRLDALDNGYGQFELRNEHLHQAWIDLVVTDERVARDLLTNDGDPTEYIASVQTLPVRELYTIVYDGRPTDVGLRGYPAVEVIEIAKAQRQKEIELLELMYDGPIARNTSAFAERVEPVA